MFNMNIYVNKHYAFFNIHVFVKLFLITIYYSNCILGWIIYTIYMFRKSLKIPWGLLVRDSSAVRLAGAVGLQSALHKENSGFAATTLGRHISTFRGHRILFSIRNPYINRFTNHFSIHSQSSYPQKVVLHSITARFCPRPYHFVIWLSFSNICHVTLK